MLCFISGGSYRVNIQSNLFKGYDARGSVSLQRIKKECYRIILFKPLSLLESKLAIFNALFVHNERRYLYSLTSPSNFRANRESDTTTSLRLQHLLQYITISRHPLRCGHGRTLTLRSDISNDQSDLI